jgi:hypothetical protein
MKTLSAESRISPGRSAARRRHFGCSARGASAVDGFRAGRWGLFMAANNHTPIRLSINN